jgi:FdrA protein
MSTHLINEVRRNFYLDSVALMRLSRQTAAEPGVVEAALMMGTPSNLEIMANAGLLCPGAREAKGNDLVIGIRAENEAAARAAWTTALAGLERPKASSGSTGPASRPRSIPEALETMPDANLALVSVPGDFAIAEARRALLGGLNVMIFSDNIPIAQERAVKKEARDLGLLVMGPDCGTAIINGIPLAFANVVRRGRIGIVGASGTGIQEVTSLIDQAGQGISHAIGVGGRDLSQEVGGITTLMAIDALDADPATDHIVVISKPPHPEVAQVVLDRVGRSTKAFTICFIGARNIPMPANAQFAPTLKAAAENVVGGGRIGAGYAFDPDLAGRKHGGSLIGLYSGGTLCAEAQLVLLSRGRNVASNAPVPGSRPLVDCRSGFDRIIDLGADEFTRGRPHPMIDPTVRDDMMRETLREQDIGAIIVDVVLGFGAHMDPASHLAGLVRGAGSHRPPVVASVTGTDRDIQDRSRQIAILEAAGIIVAPSNEQAAQVAVALCQR